MTRNEITVSVDGGHEMDRAALAALVGSLPGLRVVPRTNNPQVLLWLSSPTENELHAIKSDATVLLLTEDLGYEALPETVSGLLSRDESPASLGTAIRQVARGEQYISPSLAIALLEKHQAKFSITESEKSVIESLTDREREILDLLAQGLSNKMIAAKLYLSVRTVEGHLANIYSRLGVHSRTEAMLVTVRIR
jgi:DNA-binding NarL/FixJ family response regulator